MFSQSSRRLCSRNIRSVFDQTASSGKLSVNEFENACQQLQLNISSEGCAALYEEWFNSSDKKLVYHEFCTAIACYYVIDRLPRNEGEYEYEVFLGGACNPTTWRHEIAIPYLKKVGISYYNPQVSVWNPNLVEIEAKAKASSYLLLFVFEGWKTRAVSSFIEVAYLAAQSRNVVLVLIQNSPTDPFVMAGEHVLPTEQACLIQARDYMCEFARRLGVPLYFQLSEALEHVKHSVMKHRALVQKRANRKFSSIPPIEQRWIEQVLRVREVFKSLDPVNPTILNVEQARMGLQQLQANFPCSFTVREHGLKMFNFEQFCLEYSSYVFQHYNSELVQSSAIGFDDRENATGVHQQNLNRLRYTQSWCLPRGESLLTPAGKTSSSAESVDQPEDELTTRRKSLRNRRHLPLSLNLDNYKEFGLNSALNAEKIKSFIRSLCHCQPPSPFRYTDKPNCQPVYALYVCGPLPDGVSTVEQELLLKLCQSTNEPLSVFCVDDQTNRIRAPARTLPPQLDAEREVEKVKLWARMHSRLLLYIINSNSFSLSTMMEAAFSIGSGLPVVLCIDQLQANEVTCQPDGETGCTRAIRLSAGSRDRSNRGKRVKSVSSVESTESNPAKSSSTGSSTTSLSSGNWVNSNSYPNDHLTGLALSDVGSSSGESNSGSATTSPVYPSAMPVFNPSVDSGLGSNSGSTELLDDNLSGLDNERDKSTSISPIQDKTTILPNLWEDSVLLIVSPSAAKDHNRGRVYLTSIAQEMRIPVTNRLQEAFDLCQLRITQRAPVDPQPIPDWCE